MNDSTVPLKADLEVPRQPPRFELTYSPVAPFPRDRFIRFIDQLKVQSKDYGLIPFRLARLAALHLGRNL